MNINSVANIPNFKGEQIRLTPDETAKIVNEAKSLEKYIRDIPEDIFVARSVDLYEQDLTAKMKRQDTIAEPFITKEELVKRFKQTRADLINGFRHLADEFHIGLLTDKVAQDYDKVAKLIQDGVKKVNPRLDLRLQNALVEIREDNIKKLTLDAMQNQYLKLERKADEALDGSVDFILSSYFGKKYSK